MRQEIEDFRLERKIPYLLHFTRAENLPSILDKGLLPRSDIDDGIVEGTTNDNLRLDRRTAYNCLSIAFPNAPMFHRFKSDSPLVEWPILVIHPIVMARFDALFCRNNAASNYISGMSDTDLSSIESFKAMFEEYPDYPSRRDQYLKECDPTNVQAEVLIKGRIPPEAIYSVIFPSVPCHQRYKVDLGQRQAVVSDRRGFYGTRGYYRQWGHGKNG